MEKVIYLLWRDTQVSPDTFAHRSPGNCRHSAPVVCN